MNIPHTLSHSLPQSHLDPYGSNPAYNLPALSQAGDLHISRGYHSLATGARGAYNYPGPNPHQSYYGGLASAPLANYTAGLVQGGSGRYFGEHDSHYASTH
jgi:hypothetical protein